MGLGRDLKSAFKVLFIIVHLLDVPGNKIKGKVSKDADINRILKEYLHEHDKELKVIKKALKA